jgi:hypothetical protein
MMNSACCGREADGDVCARCAVLVPTSGSEVVNFDGRRTRRVEVHPALAVPGDVLKHCGLWGNRTLEIPPKEPWEC